MGNLISVDEVKTILQLSGSANDAFIDIMIPIVQDFTLKYCNITFDCAATFPALKLPLSQLINYQLGEPDNIVSKKIGNESITYGSTNYPSHIIAGLRPFRHAMFVSGSDDTNVHHATYHSFLDASNINAV